MNERIREIAREAGLLTHNPENRETKLDKFAELLVMELTRQDEQIHQMRNMEEHQRFLVEQIVNLLMIQHQAAAGDHNYWHVAANLIKAEYGVKE